VFSLFLLCSFLSWFISNLSDSYEARINVDLHYGNLPDSLLLGKNAQEHMEVKVKARGFQLLYYNFFGKQFDVDASQLAYGQGEYYLDGELLERQLEQQLSQQTSLIDLDRDRLVVDLYGVATREIPVKANLRLQMEQNYMLEGEIQISPDPVLVKGPARELDTLREVSTSFLELTNISSDFSREVPLILPKGLVNSVFSTAKVTLSGKVAKFSEKVFEVPVKVLNIPEGYQVQTFPNEVKLICKAPLERLKELSPSDFGVVADYGQLKSPGNSSLFLTLERIPPQVYDVRLQDGNTINFVLKQG